MERWGVPSDGVVPAVWCALWVADAEAVAVVLERLESVSEILDWVTDSEFNEPTLI